MFILSFVLCFSPFKEIVPFPGLISYVALKYSNFHLVRFCILFIALEKQCKFLQPLFPVLCWVSFQLTSINKLERIQSQAKRFITQDYTTRTKSHITKLTQELELPPLQERRKNLRLAYMYRVVEGLVPALALSITWSQESREERSRQNYSQTTKQPML